ncbi:hypothetical protein BaRGS_00014362 [Batillaria attramentaria]|uniref:Uncharacterized protein n=1 Tax=Batillaria attramentaria TaxID=370345 RepID=A0ABD0L5N6_9CAEN
MGSYRQEWLVFPDIRNEERMNEKTEKMCGCGTAGVEWLPKKGKNIIMSDGQLTSNRTRVCLVQNRNPTHFAAPRANIGS